MLDYIVNLLNGPDLQTTMCNIVAYLSLIQLIGFLFLMIGSFVRNSK